MKTSHMHTHFYTNVLVLKYAVILSQSLYMTPVWCLNRWLDIGCEWGWWGGISGCRVISHDRNHISPPPCSSCSGPKLDSTACVIRQKSMARVQIHCVSRFQTRWKLERCMYICWWHVSVNWVPILCVSLTNLFLFLSLLDHLSQSSYFAEP